MNILYSSPWIPVEWIKAHGFDPQGVWSRQSGRNHAAAEGVCAFAQHLMDLPRDPLDAAVIFTTACDQMRRASDGLADNRFPAFLFNLPATWQTPAARRLYHDEVERLGRFLVQLGGQTPTEGDLEQILIDWDRRRQRLREVLPCAGGREAAEMLTAFFDDGSTPDAFTAAPPQGIPVALVGGPLLRPQLDLFDAIHSLGGRVALNATEPGERCLLPPIGPPPAGRSQRARLADHYFDHCVDVFHRPNSRLYDWLGSRLASRQVRGIVLWVHVGCDLWRAEAASLREAFALPVLVLDEHETRGISPRAMTRLEAFLETLG